MTDQMTDLVPVDEALTPAIVGGGAIVTAPHGRPHPEPRQYVMIAVILCVVTALEVAAG